MHLRLVASDGVLIDPADAPTRAPAPDFSALSKKGRDLLYLLTIGDVPVDDGLFSLTKTQLHVQFGWGEQRATAALKELREQDFIVLVQEARGRRPRVWRLHDAWRPDLSTMDRMDAVPKEDQISLVLQQTNRFRKEPSVRV